MPKNPLPLDEIAPAPDLGRAFETSVRPGLVAALGPAGEIEVCAEISAGRRAVVAADAVVWPFWIVARFQGAGVVGQIAFGDRELWIRAAVRPRGLAAPEEGYAFWEWAAALGESQTDLTNSEWCTQPGRVAQVTVGHTAWLGRCASTLADRHGTLVPLIQAARHERARASRVAERERAMDTAAAKARAALRRGEHGLVIRLLEPYEGELPAAAAKLLGLARRSTGA